MKKIKTNKKNVAASAFKIINAASSSFRLVESYKALRTNVMFSLPEKEDANCRKILFTSAAPSEGKSATAVNLAVALAETETKVLLIDADMRKSTVHKYFELESRVGLSNLLSGMNTVEECVQKVPGMENLSVITSGILPPNPSELLGGSAMSKWLKAFEEQYNYIIFDSPPINVVADAIALVNKVDGVAFVAAYGRSTYPEITKAVDALRFANANIIGVVMNRTGADSSSRRGRYKYGGYSYKYKYYKSYEHAAERSNKAEQ